MCYTTPTVYTPAGVSHFKTTFELTAALPKLLPSMKPDQLATVVAALGAAGVADLDLFKVRLGHGLEFTPLGLPGPRVVSLPT
jgi:hypothetical protein